MAKSHPRYHEAKPSPPQGKEFLTRGDPCQQPSCSGSVEEGYCTVCGIAVRKSSNGFPVPPIPPLEKSSSTATGTGSTPVSRGVRGSRRSNRSSTRSTRKHLGAGLVSVPELPSSDPERAVLLDPRVPEHKRFCPNCDRALTRERGFCGQCGHKYSFIPSLEPGFLLAGQYEVRGALAYGGLGWIYLAFDRLLSRYVVLKGLLNTDDAAAAAVAVGERQFLAAVKHPNIVGIYNFVQLDAEGLIVMEYVGGQTLRDIRRSRGPIPPAEAIAYVHRILNAFAYLHQAHLVYCDFKPENCMLEHDDVKLIDLGGVRRIDDPKGDIYGTVGYSAPEAGGGPTVESDLYTVGRTLAVLLCDIRGFGSDHRYSLPGPQEEALFAREESLYRFLLKATAPNPGDRFESAGQMSDQLLGVLREVVAAETGMPRPGSSALFSGDMLTFRAARPLEPVAADYRHLPLPVLDTSDPAANAVMHAGSLPDARRRVEALEALVRQPVQSIEAKLRFASSLIDIGSFDAAAGMLKDLEQSDPWDWRSRWYRGRLLLAQNNPAEAQTAFDQVYFDLPGELAPKLAFGLAAELAGKVELAIHMYEVVSRTDPSFSTAAFGLARCLAAAGDRAKCVAALARIPASSSMHACSQVEAARALLRTGAETATFEDLTAVSALLESISLTGADREWLHVEVLEQTLLLLSTRKVSPSSTQRILGRPLREKDLRRGLEQSYRALAHFAGGDEKIRFVDRANGVRPRTLF